MSDPSFPLDPLDPLSWDLLDRYYAAEVTPEEAVTVQSHLAAHPGLARILAQLFDALRRSSATTRSANVNAMLAAAHERITPSGPFKRFARMARMLFNGSTNHAVAALLDLRDTELTDSDVEHLRCLIEQAKREGR